MNMIEAAMQMLVKDRKEQTAEGRREYIALAMAAARAQREDDAPEYSDTRPTRFKKNSPATPVGNARRLKRKPNRAERMARRMA